MATPANRGRGFTTRPQKAYRLEMEGRTLYILLALMGTTGLVIFYLGIVTGQAMRDPNLPVSMTSEIRTSTGESGDTPAAGSLTFNQSLTSKEEKIEGLRLESNAAESRTRNLVAEVNNQLQMEEVNKAPAANQAAATPPQNQAGNPPQSPLVETGKTPQPADNGPRYTVQVFSSQDETKSKQLVDRLRSLGFDPFIKSFKTKEGQMWYRVRVGESNRD